MEQIAYGPLALLPETFWALTPREFVDLCAGHHWREERLMSQLAWQTAYLLRPYGFEGTGASLLGNVSDQTSEVAAVDSIIGASPSYEDVMAAQRAKGLAKGAVTP